MRLLSLAFVFLFFSVACFGSDLKFCQTLAAQIESEYETLFGAEKAIGAEEICYFGMTDEDSVTSLCLDFYYLGCLEGLGENQHAK